MKDNNNYKRYKLWALDGNHDLKIIYDTETIFEMDCFTYQFDNKEDMFNKLSEKYGVGILNVFIETKGQKKDEGQKGKYNSNIMYKCNVIPEHDTLCKIYSEYLLEDRRRIMKSLTYFVPRLKNQNIFSMEDSEIRAIVNTRIKSYKNSRDIYFLLLKEGKIKLSKTSREETIQDYFRELISSINTDYPDKNPDDFAVGDGKLISDNIMLDKVISGEIEPFEYHDLEDYESAKKGRRR